MAKGDKTYFYAGIVLAESRVSNLRFSGTWIVGKNEILSDVINIIKAFESNNHKGADVALTAFNQIG